jgi:cobalt-zinc-cadmium efflux system outer membrane protein
LTFLFVAFAGNATAFGITLDGAVQQALANNKDLRAAYFEVEKARARLLQAGLWPNPELEIAGTTDRTFNNEKRGVLSAEFMQAFPLAGRLRLAKNAARVDVARAIAEIRNRERLLIGEVQKAFIEVLAAGERTAFREAQVKSGQELVTLAGQRLAAGQASSVEANTAQIEIVRLRQEIALIEVDRRTALNSLRLRLGLTPNAPLSLDGTLGQVAQKLASARVPGAAAALRPDVQDLALAGDRARAEALLARAEAWENVRVGLGIERETEADEMGGTDEMKFLGLRVSVPLPLWNRNQGRIAEQLATASQAEAQIDALKLTIRSEIDTARERARLLKEVLGSYDQQVLPLLQQSTETLRSGYSTGQTNLADIVQNRVQQFSLQASQVEAQRNYALALVDLQIASAGSPFLKTDYLVRRSAKPKTRVKGFAK